MAIPRYHRQSVKVETIPRYRIPSGNFNGNRRSIQNLRNLSEICDRSRYSLENIKFWVETAIVVGYPMDIQDNVKLSALYYLSQKRKIGNFILPVQIKKRTLQLSLQFVELIDMTHQRVINGINI
ncbi:hypothetical protein K0M31_007775 [Melipona bicolor]|uniref:Uncharacterized protein n=1 Tax=Melipona bicolor TaxID=60889 RepID=A0AA40GC53_9HYME|nr:hypothetical protein K0M31_007775 [Melipona bicolor]